MNGNIGVYPPEGNAYACLFHSDRSTVGSFTYEWKFVNVRRLFISGKRSIYEGLQRAVFDSNDERANTVDDARRHRRRASRPPGGYRGASAR
jgi:hypothetical protein